MHLSIITQIAAVVSLASTTAAAAVNQRPVPGSRFIAAFSGLLVTHRSSYSTATSTRCWCVEHNYLNMPKRTQHREDGPVRPSSLSKKQRSDTNAISSVHDRLGAMHTKQDLETVLNLARQAPPPLGGWDIAQGIQHLVKADPKFESVVLKYGIPDALVDASHDSAIPVDYDGIAQPFHALAKIIIYQQLSTSAAGTVFERVLSALLKTGESSSAKIIMPLHVLNSEFKLEVIDGKRKMLVNGEISGLSESKSKFLISLAEHFMDEKLLKGVDLLKLNDEELFQKLTAVKGLGPWSVSMFMVFNLQRANVLPLGDLGIRKGLAAFWGTDTNALAKVSNENILKRCEHWEPYNTLASLYMWKVADSLKVSGK